MSGDGNKGDIETIKRGLILDLQIFLKQLSYIE